MWLPSLVIETVTVKDVDEDGWPVDVPTGRRLGSIMGIRVPMRLALSCWDWWERFRVRRKARP